MRRRLLVAFVLTASSAPVAAQAEARITRIVIDPARSESPAFEGRTFGPDGKVGAYEKLRGKAFGDVDPDEANGQHIPFTPTKAARMAAGDPRLSLEERYGTHDGYVTAVARAAEKLEQQRLLLRADVQVYIDQARRSSVLSP